MCFKTSELPYEESRKCYCPTSITPCSELTINVVERGRGGVSAGGGIASGITSGPLAGLIGSCAVYHRSLFGRNQKINLSLERGQIDSIFRINYTDPWIEGDDKRTSRTIMIQMKNALEWLRGERVVYQRLAAVLILKDK